jgi:hypothetical protein
VDRNAYIQDPAILVEKVPFCPICAPRLRVPLWRNGSYRRLFPGEVPGEFVAVLIYRKLCRRCRTSFSLHPEPLLKRQRYSLTLVAAWLWAFLRLGAATRCRDFFESQRILVPEPDPLMSWTDTLDQPGSRSRPGYQLLHHWRVLFCSRAGVLLPHLVDAVADAGVRLSEGWKVAERARELQIAWLHWEALACWNAAGPVAPEGAFRQMVRQLAKIPSHKTRREPQRRFPYDVLIQ